MTARYLLAAVCLVLLLSSSRAREPFAHGKPLSYWMLLLREAELRVETAGPWETRIGAGPFQVSLALKALGPEARSALPALLAWFREGNESANAYRIKGAYLAAALRDVGCTDRSLAPLLRSLGALGDERLTTTVIEALESIDPAAAAELKQHQRQGKVARLLADFQTSESRVNRFQSIANLAIIDPEQASAGLPFLSELLLDPVAAGSTNKNEALCAVSPLQHMGAAARDAAPLLEYRWRQQPDVSFAIALAHIAPDRAAPLLRKESAAFRKEVASYLGNCAELPPAVASLFSELVDERNVSLDTAAELMRFDPVKAKKTLPLFVEALNDLDPLTQLRGAAVLPRLDPSRNREVAGVLRSVIANFEGITRHRARALLPSIGKEAVPALIDLLDDPRWWYSALEELPRFGSDAKEAIPALRKLLAHKNRDRWVRAAWALAWIDPDSLRTATPGLLEAINDSSSFIRGLALLTLGKIGSGNQRAIAALIGKLGSKTEPEDVVAAVHGLVGLGKEAVKPLIGRLADDDLQTRCNAAWVLAEMGPAASDALPALHKLVRDRQPIARIRAIHALARIDPTLRDEYIAGMLSPELQHDGRDGREAAITLGRLASVRRLAGAIKEELRPHEIPRAVSATNAALALRIRGPKTALNPASVAAVLTEALKLQPEKAKRPEEVRRARPRLALLLREAAELGPGACETIPAVLALWKHEELRDEVEAALAALGSPKREAIPELSKLLNDPLLRARTFALLSRLGPDVKELLPELKTAQEFDALETFASPTDAVLARVRAGAWPAWSSDAEVRFGRPRPRDVELVRKAGKEVIPELVKLLRGGRTYSVRIAAAHALGMTGPVAGKEAVPRLLAMLKEHEGVELEVLLGALWYMRLGGIGDGEMLPALRKLLKDKKAPCQVWAARRLGEFGAAAAIALPDLVEIVRDAHRKYAPEVRLAAVEALGGIGAADGEVLRVLKEASEVKFGDLTTTLPAIVALGRIGPPAKDSFPGIGRKLLFLELWSNRPLDPMKKEVLIGTLRVDPKLTPQAIDHLLTQLKLERRGAAELLATIGPEARSAVPALMNVYRTSETPVIRQEILAALKVLGPKDKNTIADLAVSARGDPDDAALLGVFGPLSSSAVGQLIDGLQTHAETFEKGNSTIRQTWKGTNYVEALGAIGPGARAAVPELLKLHEQWRKEPFVYLRIAAALKKIDPMAARKAGIP
jgi:HEAT repeat protein